MRTLHSVVAVVGLVVEEDDDDDEGEVDDVDGVVPDTDVEVVAGTVVVGADEVDSPGGVVGEAGAIATGLSPTWESARPTICHVSTVATTSAETQAAAIRHEIIS